MEHPPTEAVPPDSPFKIDYPPELPISKHVGEIAGLVRDHQVVIVCGTTGSGKTTQLPKIMLESGRGRKGRIGCTQPRRLAANAMARRVASELNVPFGAEVGCKVRFDDHTSKNTAVKFMTDGILLAETRNDRALRQYDTLIIDEAHERSLNIDFILGYLKNLLKKRPDLRIVISSATLDAEQFSEFFGNAPVVEVEGRTYPIEDQFMPPDEDEELSAHIWRAVRHVSDLDRNGDILVFLPGEREIRDATNLLDGKKLPYTDILPLFGRLSLSDQQKVFNPGRNRRIILATNVAETSITIPRIQYVIDSGLVRLSRYNPRTRIQELQIEQVSQAGSRQRRGRCGRLRDGVCVYLYDEDLLTGSPEYTDPEICRTSLAGVILQMALLGLPRIEHFPLINPPNPTLVREGYRSLLDIGAIDPKGALTDIGRRLSRFQIDPHLARMICEAESRKVLPETLVIAAYLSIQDPRERPLDKQQAADQAHRQWHDPDSDFLGILKLWNMFQQERTSNGALRRWCRRNFLNYNRVREWQNLYLDLWESASELDFMQDDMVPQQVFDHYSPDLIHKALLSGLPANIGMWDQELLCYRGTRERKFFIFPGSGLFKRKPTAQWVMTCSLVETSRVYARQAAVIKPEWIEEIAPHLCKKIHDNVQWNPKAGFVYARERVTSGGLLIHNGRRVHYGPIDPVESRKIFIRDGLAPGDLQSKGKWLELHLRMLERIRRMEIKIRRPGSLLDPEAIYEHFEHLVPPEICSTNDFDEWLRANRVRAAMNLEDALLPQYHPVHFDDYPDELIFGGHPFRLNYFFDPGEQQDGIFLMVPEAEMNLLPPWALEWLVPGWLPEKIEFMTKSLPKELRIACNPLAEAVSEFCARLRDETVSREQHLDSALAEYLSERARLPVQHGDFNTDQLPSYLKMRAAELNRDGKIVKYHDSLSGQGAYSRLSAAVTGAADWISGKHTAWPPGDFPDEVELNGKTVYPALVDEEMSVGRQLFLDEQEANSEHRAGLIRLFRLSEAQQIKFFERHVKLPRQLMLDLYQYDSSRRYEQDFSDMVIYDALTNGGTLPIRDAKTFELRKEKARENMVELAEERQTALSGFFELADSVKELLRKAPVGGEGSSEDIQLELQFFFRPGFLTGDAVWNRYPRYLKALHLRAGRFIAAPFKDSDKLEQILPFQDRFDAAVQAVDFDRSPGLYQFWLLLEEFRIQQFAPEVKPLEKASAERLWKAWEKLRLK
jgi:ATP-dependent helicase HrpA